MGNLFGLPIIVNNNILLYEIYLDFNPWDGGNGIFLCPE